METLVYNPQEKCEIKKRKTPACAKIQEIFKTGFSAYNRLAQLQAEETKYSDNRQYKSNTLSSQ